MLYIAYKLFILQCTTSTKILCNPLMTKRLCSSCLCEISARNMKGIHFISWFHSPLAGATIVFYCISTPVVPWNLTVVNFHFNITISIILTRISLWKCKLAGFTRNFWENRLQLKLFQAVCEYCQHFVCSSWEKEPVLVNELFNVL